MNAQPAPHCRPPDRLAQRHHRHQRGDPDRRRGVRRGLRRRLGARDPVRARRHRRAHPAGGAVCARRLCHDRFHPRRAARRAVYAPRSSALKQEIGAPQASNTYGSLNKLNVCSPSAVSCRNRARNFARSAKKMLREQTQNTYLHFCPISHVPVVVCQSVGIRTRGRTAAKG